MFFLHLVELQDQEDFILERTIHAPLKLQMHLLQLYMLFLSSGIYCAIPYIFPYIDAVGKLFLDRKNFFSRREFPAFPVFFWGEMANVGNF